MSAILAWSKVPELSGLIGSIALAVPSAKHAWAQWHYKRYKDVPAHRPETKALDREAEEQMKRKAQQIYAWDPVDFGSVFFGSLCLAVSFAASFFT